MGSFDAVEAVLVDDGFLADGVQRGSVVQGQVDVGRVEQELADGIDAVQVELAAVHRQGLSDGGIRHGQSVGCSQQGDVACDGGLGQRQRVGVGADEDAACQCRIGEACRGVIADADVGGQG